MAIPTWKMFPALLCGNTVVLKPAEDTPHTATRLVEILTEAGIPPGVVNLLHGRGEEVGAALVRHPAVQLVSFTGSAVVGREIASACGQNLKRVSLELGGKNAQIVMEDADLELAVEGALWGAFGTTGQRCTATSRLIVHRDVVKAMPLGAMIARADISTWTSSTHGSTFGGNPVACAAALATLQLLEEGLVENAAKVGAILKEKLLAVKTRHAAIGDVRGLGLMIGVDFERPDGSYAPDGKLRDRIMAMAVIRSQSRAALGKVKSSRQ